MIASNNDRDTHNFQRNYQTNQNRINNFEKLPLKMPKIELEQSKLNSSDTRNKNKFNKKKILKGISIKNICINLFLAFILLSIPLFFILNIEYPGTDATYIEVDGDFQDWDEKDEFNDNIDTVSNPDIDITKCKISRISDSTSFYIEVNGEILKGHEDKNGDLSPDTVRILIDSDKNTQTGYAMSELGADYMIEVQGKNGKILMAPLYKFDPQHRTESIRPRNDWNCWKQLFGVNAKANGNKLELQVSIPYFADKNKDNNYDDQIIAKVQTMDSIGNQDVCEQLLSNVLNSLIVSQTNIAPKVLTSSVTDVLKLEFSAKGSNVEISSIKITHEGGGILSGLSFPIFVPKDTTKEYKLKLDSSSLSPATAVSIKIQSADDITVKDNIPVTLIGNGAIAYVKSLPNTIKIDGAFDDWKTVEKVKDNDEIEIENENIDIQNYALHSSESELSFYVNVKGVILNGNVLPKEPTTEYVNIDLLADAAERRGIDIPDLPKRTGEDYLYIFLDTDHDLDTGYSPSWFPFGADYLIEIIGQKGSIKTSSYYEFKGNDNQVEWIWSDSMGEIPVGLLDSELESQITFEQLGTDQTPKVFYYLMDWTYIGDCSKSDLKVPTQVYSTYKDLMGNGGRGITSYLVINELKYDSSSIGDQYIELFNPTDNDIGENFVVYSIRGPKVIKILTLMEDVSAFSWKAWNPDSNRFEVGDKLILKDDSNNTVDVVHVPHNLSSGDSYQRFVDSNDGMPIDTGGAEDFFTGDFYISDITVGDTLDFPNTKSNSIPEFYDIIIPILLLILFAIVVQKCFKKSKQYKID